MSHEALSREQGNATTSQGLLPTPPRSSPESLCPEPLEGAWPWGLWTPSPEPQRVNFRGRAASFWVLLWQPQDTHTHEACPPWGQGPPGSPLGSAGCPDTESWPESPGSPAVALLGKGLRAGPMEAWLGLHADHRVGDSWRRASALGVLLEGPPCPACHGLTLPQCCQLFHSSLRQ